VADELQNSITTGSPARLQQLAIILENTHDTSTHQLESLTIVSTLSFLKINLSAKEKRRSMFFLIIMSVFFVLFIIYSIPRAQIKNQPPFVYLMAIVVLFIPLVFYFNSIFKTIRNLQTRIIGKNVKVVELNGKILCDNCEIKKVIIQPKISLYGFGQGYTIGIGFDDKTYPLIYALTQKEILEISNIIADFLECKIEERKQLLFSFLTKW